ncbi:hypothetical protein [Ensifer soli]|uniref:hypothetical protein n=1 Tax=Ciceribacter sp. sgz301302 TaxID=3342379 RepID=UPI0035BAF90F
MEPSQKVQPGGSERPQDESGLVLRLDRLRPEKRIMTAKPQAAKAAPAAIPNLPQHEPVEPEKKPKAPLPRETKKTVVYRSKRLHGLSQRVRNGISGTVMSLLAIVLLPTVAAGLYFAFVATPQYVSEFRFSVRPSDATQFQASVALESALIISNSYIVAEYSASRETVDALEKTVGLREIYSNEGIDYLSRLDPDASVEQLVSYWKNRITTHFDMATGISTIAVSAFTPEDALKITQELQLLCEKLVNDLSEKARKTQMAFAQSELDLAEQRLKDARDRDVALRAGQQSVDATKEAEGKLQLAARLRSNLSDLQSEFVTLSSYLDASSPKIAYLKKQIAAAEQQVANLQAQVGGGDDGSGTMSANDATRISQFEASKTDIDIATKLYQSSLQNYETARMKANSNQLYLATFIHPNIAQLAAYPRIFVDTFVFFLCTLGAWIVLTLIYYSVRDHA